MRYVCAGKLSTNPPQLCTLEPGHTGYCISAAGKFLPLERTGKRLETYPEWCARQDVEQGRAELAAGSLTQCPGLEGGGSLCGADWCPDPFCHHSHDCPADACTECGLPRARCARYTPGAGGLACCPDCNHPKPKFNGEKRTDSDRLQAAQTTMNLQTLLENAEREEHEANADVVRAAAIFVIAPTQRHRLSALERAVELALQAQAKKREAREALVNHVNGRGC